MIDNHLDPVHPDIRGCTLCSGIGKVWAPERDSRGVAGTGFNVDCTCVKKVAFRNYMGDFYDLPYKKYPAFFDDNKNRAVTIRATWENFRPYMAGYLVTHANELKGDTVAQIDPRYTVLDQIDLSDISFGQHSRYKTEAELDRFRLLVILLDFSYNNKFALDYVQYVASARERSGLTTWIVTSRVGLTLRMAFAPDEAHPAFTNAEKLCSYLGKIPIINKGGEHKGWL